MQVLRGLWGDARCADDGLCAPKVAKRGFEVSLVSHGDYEAQVRGVQGDLIVPQFASLTIEPGTVVRFDGGDLQISGIDIDRTELTIQGTLNAAGTGAQPILFEANGGSIRHDGSRGRGACFSFTVPLARTG